jgi:quinol monooxygenase YgiN
VIQYTTDLLFRDLWLRPDLMPRDRSLATVSALVAGTHAAAPAQRNQESDMKAKLFLTLCSSLLTLCLSRAAGVQEAEQPYVRLAELEIDPAQMERFNAAIREGVATAVRVEPGVLALYAVSEKDHPNRVRVFEIYKDEAAYQKHLQTPHFRKFRGITDKMVKSRKLLDGVPIVLEAKPVPVSTTGKEQP